MTTTVQHICFFKYRLLKKVSGVVLLLLTLSVTFSHAQNSTTGVNKLKAVFLFNFTRFIDWPESAFVSPESPFIIGILGGTPELNEYIEESVTGELVGTHTIIVQHYEDENGPFNCQMLYIDLANSSKIRTALTAVENHSILTVSDAVDFNKYGGIIRFYTEEKKIRLQINTDAAKSAQLNISSKLLNLAKTK